MSATDQLLDDLERRLAGTGLDLLQPTTAQTYNAATAALAADRLQPLPTFGRACTAAAVIGNTKALW